MAVWTVTKIIDGDTFEVSPNWKWNDQSGSRVRPIGYDAPEIGTVGGAGATDALRQKLQDKQVNLTDCATVDRGRLVCVVLCDGVDISTWF